ncbi:MAG: putative ABC transporter permease [Clostridium sp.]|uniref:putative ABC transporter permease n=1 Tax=Clostridium sp. TaxID=1506 RepID=UPI0025B91EE0|nr:putative ABC transporter permease [Clostridium sp.]MCE5221910.1 putative ABC transporter permease [Clostridium sp.]
MHLLFYMTFNFVIYSFIGWIIEEVYLYVTIKKIKKEGFLKGPFKPMYGIASTILILYNQILDIDGIPLILLCFLIPTTVEYISGYMLKHIFNKVYWDYSNLKYNIYGFVTLKFSLYWTLLSFMGVYFLQPAVYNIYKEFEKILIIAVCFLSIILTIDLILTLKHFRENTLLSKQVRD